MNEKEIAIESDTDYWKNRALVAEAKLDTIKKLFERLFNTPEKLIN